MKSSKRMSSSNVTFGHCTRHSRFAAVAGDTVLAAGKAYLFTSVETSLALTHHLLLVFCMHNRNPLQKIGNPTKALVSLSTDIKELLQQLNHKIEEVVLLSLLACRRSSL